MKTLIIEKAVVVRNHVFSRELGWVPYLQGVPEQDNTTIELPEGTSLRGLWWVDELGRPRIKWVAWVG